MFESNLIVIIDIVDGAEDIIEILVVPATRTLSLPAAAKNVFIYLTGALRFLHVAALVARSLRGHKCATLGVSRSLGSGFLNPTGAMGAHV